MLNIIFPLLTLASIISADNPCCSKLDKPTLKSDLGYLEDGFDQHLPHMNYTKDQWESGSIPQLCKDITGGSVYDSVKYNVEDIEVWNIKYDDCDEPWVFCHHKNSNVTIDPMASQFGRLPIQMRQWVRHVIDLPSDDGWAFTYDGAITFMRPVTDMLNTFIHETGHVLDANAYVEGGLSVSDLWWDAYNLDPKVSDGYASTNQLENVAQNTVVTTYNEIVPGGFSSIEPNWGELFHQVVTLGEQGRLAGQGNSIFKPGSSGKCVHHLPNSPTVSSKDKRDVSGARGVNERSDGDTKELVLRRAAKRTDCTLRW